MSTREVMQMALDALETEADIYIFHDPEDGPPESMYEAIVALRAELAKPDPVPIVWVQSNHLDKFKQHACGADSMLARCSHRQLQQDYVPLYREEDI